MSTPLRIATAAAIGVLAVGGVFYLLGPGSRSNVGGPLPSQTPSTAPKPTVIATPPASAAASVLDYHEIGGRILVEHLGNAIDSSEMPTSDAYPERRRFYFITQRR